MKRELVKSLRTVCLLAMFSQDNSTVSNIQSSLKSMSIMEPDLVLHPILERAIPSLEALEQVRHFSENGVLAINLDLLSDAPDHCGYQSPRCSRACYRLPGCLLPRSKVPPPYSATTSSWNRFGVLETLCTTIAVTEVFPLYRTIHQKQ